MFCPTCGTRALGDARFCRTCGSAIAPLSVATMPADQLPTVFCPSCGLVCPTTAAFCVFCGGCTRCGTSGTHDPHGGRIDVARTAGTAPYADFGSRFVAHALIDGAIGCAILIALAALDGIAPGGATAGIGVLGWAAYLWWGNARGQSLGKRAVGIRVVRADTGTAPGWSRGLGRTLGYMLSCGFFWIGYLWSTWDARHQALHDKIAGTVVINDSRHDRDVFVPERPRRSG